MFPGAEQNGTIVLGMSRSLTKKWDQRIERARELAAAHSFAGEALRFYERIGGFQKSLYAGLGDGIRLSGSLRGDLDPSLLLPWFGRFLSLIQEIAPPPLARSAAELSAGRDRWGNVLADFWRAGGEEAASLSDAEALIAWTFLQPCAEHLADQAGSLEVHGTPPVCPRCSGRPLAGVLRPMGDGAMRSLICRLCATEWDYRRLVCPACGEENAEKLPVYIAEELGHVRVEACDTCRHYIKTIDLTKSGRAVPVVDELAAIPLSLWAAENGYIKVSRNLLGL
jgi:FdhE protein